MTDGMDRDELIGLLDQLGEESDQAVLAAARAIHAKVTAAEESWDDLLAGPVPAGAEPAASAARDDEDDVNLPPLAAGPVPDDTESLRLIERLLETRNVSEALRSELGDYKADIETGEFADDDRRYLRALYQRLAKP